VSCAELKSKRGANLRQISSGLTDSPYLAYACQGLRYGVLSEKQPKNRSKLYQPDRFYRNFWEQTLTQEFDLAEFGLRGDGLK
jgi:hypothetical protein